MVRQVKFILTVVFLLVSTMSISSCGTAKGAAEGMGSTAAGAVNDVQGLWHGILTADEWVKKNLW